MKTPFHLLLIRTYHAQKNRLRPEMAGIGLSPGQPKILNRLMEKDCCMQKELAESCDIQPATVSRMLDTMEQAGLVCRQEEAPRRRGGQRGHHRGGPGRPIGSGRPSAAGWARFPWPALPRRNGSSSRNISAGCTATSPAGRSTQACRTGGGFGYVQAILGLFRAL